MSIDYGVYVGPYVQCAVERVPVTRLQITCPTEGCENHGKGMRQPYCQLCGAKVASLPYTELGFAIDQWEVRDELNERLAQPSGDGYYRWKEDHNIHLWVPNIDSPGRHLDTRADFELYQIPLAQVQAEIDMFQSQFAADLSCLRERYGNLTIHWGVVQDYS